MRDTSRNLLTARNGSADESGQHLFDWLTGFLQRNNEVAFDGYGVGWRYIDMADRSRNSGADQRDPRSTGGGESCKLWFYGRNRAVTDRAGRRRRTLSL